RPDELWAKVLITKGFTLKRQKVHSAVWRGVLSVWNDTLNSLQWSIKDGKRTKFWTDVWLDSRISLFDYANNIQGVEGRLIHDCEGRLVASYAANLGSCSIMRAQLRGIIDGMRLAWIRVFGSFVFRPTLGQLLPFFKTLRLVSIGTHLLWSSITT
ncbi:hypothetical protein LINPERHAP1_LOCUS37823, partial [Linum perenne]